MTAKTLMIQGTASSVGKSVLVTGLCRIFRQDGYKVAPFKSQNMALNSFVTREGGEIGRAQAVQAEAAGIEPEVIMNPVLLKPEAGSHSQVIVLGKVATDLKAHEYYQHAPYLLGVIEKCLEELRSKNDIIVIEGAGSPAEINISQREIVNMRIARLAGSPVLLAGDIDRGGVFASLLGTLMLLSTEDRRRVKALIINKFRGDLELFKPGLKMLEEKARKPVLGVVPYIRDLKIAQEDSVYLDEQVPSYKSAELEAAVIRLPHISNYDDFDPLSDLGCSVRYVSSEAEIGDPDLLILPGTKSTVNDLLFLHQTGMAEAILRRARGGTPVIGICGGFQMLGCFIRDMDRVESGHEFTPGLALLDGDTIFGPAKTTTQVTARVAAGEGLLAGLGSMEVKGYEIHMGQSSGALQPAFRVIGTPSDSAEYPDGAVSPDGWIMGSYLHGLFHNPEFTRGLLSNLRKKRGLVERHFDIKSRDSEYDRLADVLRQSLDMGQIYRIIDGKGFKR